MYTFLNINLQIEFLMKMYSKMKNTRHMTMVLIIKISVLKYQINRKDNQYQTIFSINGNYINF